MRLVQSLRAQQGALSTARAQVTAAEGALGETSRMSWLSIIFTFALVDNVILSRLLGIRPAAGAPGGMRAAAGVGGFMAVLMAACGLGGWVLDSLVLVPLGFTLLRTPVFVFLVAGLAFALQAVGERAACPRSSVTCAYPSLPLASTSRPSASS